MYLNGQEGAVLVRTSKWLSLMCGIALLAPTAACSRLDPSKATQHTESFEVEIVYKRNQICYAISNQNENHSLYTFNAAGLPVITKDGTKGTASALKPGMCVTVQYDGYMLETYPAQFSGVTDIEVNEVRANDVEFVAKQISGMFPSTSPGDSSKWDISFDGVSFLSEDEKVAVQFILSENWSNTNVTIDSSENVSENTSRITIQVNEYSEQTLDLTITVNTGEKDEKPSSRTIQATLQDGAWTTD